MRKLLFAAAALVIATPAHAYVPTVCEFGIGVVACNPMSVNPSAKIIHVEPTLNEGANGPTETRVHWIARCKPMLSRRDPLTGMRYWAWAQPGCEYGPE